MKTLSTIFLIFSLISCNKVEKYQNKYTFKPKNLSKIDSLKTIKEIESFVTNNLDLWDQTFKLKSIKDFDRQTSTKKDPDRLTKLIAERLNVDYSYCKTDLDHNGFTDLVVIGDAGRDIENNKSYGFDSYVFMNFKNDSISSFRLTSYPKSSLVPQLINQNNKNLLILHKPQIKIDDFKSDTLTFKFGNFIEFNDTLKNTNIEQLKFSTGPCFGTCPIFDLEINFKGKSKFNADVYNFSDGVTNINGNEGTFETIINKLELNEIKSILNYIEFEKLKNEYSTDISDIQGGKLEIMYDNGKIKKITDRGLRGSYGLILLYEKLYKLRFDQNWKKIK